jgi:hypothetical protein
MMFIASKRAPQKGRCENVQRINLITKSPLSLRSRLTHHLIDNRSPPCEIGTKEYTVEQPVKETIVAKN